MRENLIDLLRKAEKEDYESRTQDEHYSYMADFLIANGVTVLDCQRDCKSCWKTQLVTQKWIPVSERLPEVGETAIALGSRGGVYVAKYKGSIYWHKLNARCHMCEPTHWMPLPEPPKEDQ